MELKTYGPICCLACGTDLSKTLNYEQITLYCRHIISKKGADWDHINWFKPATMLCISEAITLVYSGISSDVHVFIDFKWEVVVCLVELLRIPF